MTKPKSKPKSKPKALVPLDRPKKPQIRTPQAIATGFIEASRAV